MKLLALYLYSLMVILSPPGPAAERASRIDPAQAETQGEREARYVEIASALASVIEDPAEDPIFRGPAGRALTAVTMLAVGWMESGFRKDVHTGVGKLARGGGVDSCVMQVRVSGGKTNEGWTHEDLTRDLDKCFRAALHIMRASYYACRELPPEHRLSSYASGSCSSPQGRKSSEARVAVARRLLKLRPLVGAVPAAEPGPVKVAVGE